MRQIDQTKPITAVIFVKGFEGQELISLKTVTSKRNRQNTCESIKIVPSLGKVVVSTSFPPRIWKDTDELTLQMEGLTVGNKVTIQRVELSQTFRPPLHQGIETCDFSKFGY
jgi:hypothetical protein